MRRSLLTAFPLALFLALPPSPTTAQVEAVEPFKVGTFDIDRSLIQGNDGDAWRPCQIFPGKAVAAAGWCSVWAPKA